MRELWNRLEAYFATHWPQKELCLRPPATLERIEAAEGELGVRFPADFRESLLVHDGQDPHPSVLWLPGVGQLGSLDSMVECWKSDRQFFDPTAMVQPDESARVLQSFFHPMHISFAGSPDWDHDRLLFDFEPGPEGSHAQIIMRYDIDLVYVCDTFRQLVEITVDGLEDETITMVDNGPSVSHWITPVYRSPRVKKQTSMFAYFARALRLRRG